MGAGSFQTSQEQAASHPRRGRGQPEGRPPALSLARAGPGRPPEGSCGAPSQSLTPPPALTSCRGLSTLQARLLERGRGRGEGDNRCSSLRGKEPRPLRGREPSPREWGPILTPHVRGAPRVLRSRRPHPSLPRVTPPPGLGARSSVPQGSDTHHEGHAVFTPARPPRGWAVLLPRGREPLRVWARPPRAPPGRWGHSSLEEAHPRPDPPAPGSSCGERRPGGQHLVRGGRTCAHLPETSSASCRLQT